MELHHGQTIERIIRRNGYSITELARLTGVNRRSVYNWFNQRHLKPEVIYRIGVVINYDFSSLFPGLFPKDDFMQAQKMEIEQVGEINPLSKEDSSFKDKYIELLEKHNELLLTYLNQKSSADQS